MVGSAARLKGFLLAVLVWLPLAFLAWALFATGLAWLPGKITGWLLTGVWSELFRAVEQHGSVLQVSSAFRVQVSGGIGELVFDLPTMQYGYGLPLLAALLMATPILPSRRIVQFLLALPLLWLGQVFGLVGHALRLVVFDAGPVGAAVAASAGLSANLVALWYQFASLIVPSVLPVALWLVLNRGFMDELGRPTTEPAAP